MPAIKGFDLDLSGAKVRRANLSRANLTRADLSYAELTGANLRWEGAVLIGTISRGADIREVKKLAKEQLVAAVVDETTILPTCLSGATSA